MKLESPAFSEGAPIPKRFSCEGSDLSPALRWEAVPPSTKSFALTCEDPDAPGGTWVHWVIYGIPATATGLTEGVAPTPQMPDGTMQGQNSWGRIGYRGPCPPPGKPHRYVFKLMAMGNTKPLAPGMTMEALEKAMTPRALAVATTMGTYARGR
jgi:Raf kinase inhibitor-like YbhB/YbcL family protein